MLENLFDCKQKIEVLIPVNIFMDSDSPNVFVYGKDKNFTATYSTSNLLNSSGNDVGDVKFDLKTIVSLGGLNTNFTGVYKFNDCSDEYFVYISGIRQYEFVSGGKVIVGYENAVVSSFVKNGESVDNANVEFLLTPDNQLVTIFTY